MWFNDDDEPFDLAQDSDQAAESDEDLSYERPDMWVAHDRPDRPLAYGAWLCDCSGCLRAKARRLRVRSAPRCAASSA